MKTLLVCYLISTVSLLSLEPHRPIPIRPSAPSPLQRQYSEYDVRSYQRDDGVTPPSDTSSPNSVSTSTKCSCFSRCSRDTKIIIGSVTGLVTTLTTALIVLMKYYG